VERVFYNPGKKEMPIKVWAKDIELGAMSQAFNVAKLPFAFKHLALMPDVHQGYGVPIGSVFASKNVIIPNAVGVDIGCGVLACKTNMNGISKDDLIKLVHLIKRDIPTGTNHRNQQTKIASNLMRWEFISPLKICSQEYQSMQYQLGTLGGGNHFIEIQLDQNGFVWIMIHSGSRNLGYKVANYYNKVAISSNKRWFSGVPLEHELAFLPAEEANKYLAEMNFCISFAKENRAVMLQIILENLVDNGMMHDISHVNKIDSVHNFVRLENHFGNNVWIHRKGATVAKKDTLCVIPGSSGTASYICQGRSNKESYYSCSHGAGRTMSRTQAKKDLNFNEQIKLLNDKNILHDINDASKLDEAPHAYKNIDVVMKNQEDLVKIVTKLQPIAVIKG